MSGCARITPTRYASYLRVLSNFLISFDDVCHLARLLCCRMCFFPLLQEKCLAMCALSCGKQTATLFVGLYNKTSRFISALSRCISLPEIAGLIL